MSSLKASADDLQDFDAPLTEIGQQRAELGAQEIYSKWADGTVTLPDVFLVSPCKRTQQTAQPYILAYEHLTGEKAKVIAAWGLREQAGCIASNVERDSWDIPTVMGSTRADNHDADWTKAGFETDLMPRARDAKDLLETISSKIHSHTGKGTNEAICLSLFASALIIRHVHHGILTCQYQQADRQDFHRKATLNVQWPKNDFYF